MQIPPGHSERVLSILKEELMSGNEYIGHFKGAYLSQETMTFYKTLDKAKEAVPHDWYLTHGILPIQPAIKVIETIIDLQNNDGLDPGYIQFNSDAILRKYEAEKKISNNLPGDTVPDQEKQDLHGQENHKAEKQSAADGGDDEEPGFKKKRIRNKRGSGM